MFDSFDWQRHMGEFGLAQAMFVTAGLLLIWSGMVCLEGIAPPFLFDGYVFHTSIIVTSVMMVLMSMAAMKDGHITEGVMSLFIGLSCASGSATFLMYGRDMSAFTDLLFSFAIIAFAAVYLSRRKYLPAAAAFLLWFCMVMPAALGLEGAWYGPMRIVSGAGFVAYGILQCRGYLEPAAGRITDIPYELVVIVGFFVMAVHGLLSAMVTYDGAFYVTALILAVIMTCIGLIGVLKGILLEGMFILTYAISCILFSFGSILGGGFIITDTFCAMVIAVCGAAMLLRRQYLPGAAALIMGLAAIPGPLFDQGVCWQIGSSIMAVLLLVYSASRWVLRESNRLKVSARITDDLDRYNHYSDLGRLAITPTMGMFMLSILCMTAVIGLTPLEDALGVGGITSNIMVMIMSVIVLAFSLISMWARMIAETILLMLTGVMTALFVLAEMTFGSSGFIMTNLVMIAGYTTCAMKFYGKKQMWRTSATVVMCICICMSLGTVSPNSGAMLMAGGYAYMAFVTFVSACKKTYVICVEEKKYNLNGIKVRQDPESYARTLVATVGSLAIAMLALVLGYDIADQGSDPAILLVKIIFSVIISGFGLYSLKHGLEAQGLMMHTTSMITLSSSILAVLGIPDSGLFSLLMSFIFLPLTYSFAKAKNWIAASVNAILFLVFSFGYFITDAIYLDFGVSAIRVLSCVMAISACLSYETDERIYSSLHRFTDIINGKSSSHRSDTSKVVAASHLTIGMLSVWCGLNYVLIASGIGNNVMEYHWVRIVICAFSLLYVRHLLSIGMLTEGMMSLFIGASSMAFSISVAVFDVEGAVALEIIFAIGILMTAILFIIKRSWFLAIAAAGIGVVYMLPVITNTGATYPLGAIALSTGSALVIVSQLGLMLGARGDKILDSTISPVKHAPESDYASLMICTAGMFTAGLLLLMEGLYGLSLSFTVSELFLSAMALCAAAFAIYAGRVDMTLLIMCAAMPAMAVEIAMVMGWNTGMELQILTTLFGSVAALAMYAGGNRPMAFVAAATAILSILGCLTGIWNLCVAGTLIFAVGTIVYAGNKWFGAETGRIPIPALYTR